MKTLLTRIEYVRILAAVGESREPLSSYELTKEMRKRGWLETTAEKDLTRKLRKLNPLPYEQSKTTFLFDLDKFQSSPRDSYYMIQTLNKINDILDLGLEIGTRIGRERYHLNEEIQIDKKYDEGVIEIRIGSNKFIFINVGKQSGFILYLIKNEDKTLERKEERDLSIKSSGKTKLVYVKMEIPDRIWFLYITLTDKARKLSPLLDQYWDYIRNWHKGSYMEIRAELLEQIFNSPECMKIINDSKHWKYSLNFRGFLLFLAGESRIKPDDVKSDQRIRDVLINPVILTIAPFLEYWDIFEQIEFNILNTLRNIGRDFEDHLYLKDFTEEDLVYLITQRYTGILEQYLTFVHMYSFPANIPLYRKCQDLEIENIRKRYLSKILNKQKHYLDQKVSEIEEKLSLLA
ncbi:MAG: hypothetical protein ACRD8Z_15750 [Nitrososphaeraceae archaeon]